MKLKSNVKASVLLGYNFHENNEEYKEDNGIDEYHTLNYFKGYVFGLGHSRRGQFYYLLCSYDGQFSIYASKPDGSGGILPIFNQKVFSKLFSDSIVE